MSKQCSSCGGICGKICQRENIKQQQHEPIAWMVYTLDGKSVCIKDNPTDFTDKHHALPLYTTSQQRKPLTDEQCDKLVAEVMDAVAKEKGLDHAMHLNGDISTQPSLRRAIVRAAHSIKVEA